MDQVALSAFFKSVVEKTINVGSSLISDQLLKVVFREENMIKCEILLDRLELHLKRIQNGPVVELQNRRNLVRLMGAFKKQSDLLNKHKQQPEKSNEENGQQAVTVPSILALFDSIKYSFSDNVQDINWFVEQAEDLLKQVKVPVDALDDQIRRNPRRMPLVRHLIKREGISVSYSTGQGSQKRKCYIWPFYLQERGVEAVLRFQYSDSIIPAKSFTIDLFLRLRESTDIVGIAIRCLKLIPSQLNLVRKFAKCELDQLAQLHGDFSWQYFRDWYSEFEDSDHSSLSKNSYDSYRETTVKARPDSFCCTADADEHGPLPEQISYFNFCCHIAGAVNDNVASSSKDAKPPLEVNLTFAPHAGRAPLGGMGGIEKHKVLQQFLENVAQNATENFVHQPQFTSHTSRWCINHGLVQVLVSKSTI